MNEPNKESEKSPQKKYSHSFRKAWIVIDLIIISVTVIIYNNIENLTIYSDSFTYWGFAIAIIAVIISIFEILDSLSCTKELTAAVTEKTKDIEKQNQELINNINSVIHTNQVMLITECIDSIDLIIDYIDKQLFDIAIILIRQVRKNISKIDSNLLNLTIKPLTYKGCNNTFSSMEKTVESYRTSQTKATKISKNDVTEAKHYFAELRNKLQESISTGA